MRATPLKHLCFFIGRGSAPNYSESDFGDALAVGQSCQRPDRCFDLGLARWHEGAIPSKGQLRRRDILVNSTGTGTMGRAALVPAALPDVPMFVDSHVTLLRVDERQVDPRYLAYVFGLPAFRSFVEEGLGVGATKQRELNVDALRSHRVAVPGLPDQSRFADFLDRECERIMRLGEALADLSSSALEEHQAMIGEEASSSNSSLTPLAALTDPSRPIMYGIVLPGDPVSDGRLLVKGGNVERNKLRPEDLVRVAPEVERPYSRARIKEGDLLVTIRGSYGAVAYVPAALSGANITQDTARVAPGVRTNPRYLLHALKSSRTQGDLRESPAVSVGCFTFREVVGRVRRG